MKNTGAEAIGERRPQSLAAIEACAFGASYVLLSLILMVVNSTKLRLSDPKLGPDGWYLYWPLWAFCFSPAVVVAIVVRMVGRPIQGNSWWFYLPALVVILAAMEGSFAFDLKWPAVLAEQLVLCIGAYVFGRQHSRHDG